MIIDCILTSSEGTGRAMVTMNALPDMITVRDFNDDSESGGVIFGPRQYCYMDVEWIHGQAWWHCSQCDEVYDSSTTEPYPYCPNCGSKVVK